MVNGTWASPTGSKGASNGDGVYGIDRSKSPTVPTARRRRNASEDDVKDRHFSGPSNLILPHFDHLTNAQDPDILKDTGTT